MERGEEPSDALAQRGRRRYLLEVAEGAHKVEAGGVVGGGGVAREAGIAALPGDAVGVDSASSCSVVNRSAWNGCAFTTARHDATRSNDK